MPEQTVEAGEVEDPIGLETQFDEPMVPAAIQQLGVVAWERLCANQSDKNQPCADKCFVEWITDGRKTCPVLD